MSDSESICLDEVNKDGRLLVYHKPEELEQNYAELKGVKTSVGVYQYARGMEINDPTTEHLKVWMSCELQRNHTSFFKSRSFNITDMPETDQQYLLFGFLNTIFVGSDIVARGSRVSWAENGFNLMFFVPFYSSEISSEANASAINSSRQLSSISAINKRKMGRRGDTIYKYGMRELRCYKDASLFEKIFGIKEKI
ncbi:hypothetical protein BDC45DRAFT_534752 [Circinella umbellata]|nr:hypothetical protein BDC45DRAFT_534752 [Circinella umbellata]